MNEFRLPAWLLVGAVIADMLTLALISPSAFIAGASASIITYLWATR